MSFMLFVPPMLMVLLIDCFKQQEDACNTLFCWKKGLLHVEGVLSAIAEAMHVLLQGVHDRVHS